LNVGKELFLRKNVVYEKTTMSQYSFSGRSRNPILSWILIILVLIDLWYVARGIFWVLTWTSPILLIITLVMDKEVVVDYLKTLWGYLTTSPFFGIICCGLTFFGAPVVIFYLFLKVMMRRQAKKFQQRFEQRFRDFEQMQHHGDDHFNQRNRYKDDEGFSDYEEVKDNRLG
jgi:hypothetical protein